MRLAALICSAADSLVRHFGRVDGIWRVFVNTTMADAVAEALQSSWWDNLTSNFYQKTRFIDCQTVVWASHDWMLGVMMKDELLVLICWADGGMLAWNLLHTVNGNVIVNVTAGQLASQR